MPTGPSGLSLHPRRPWHFVDGPRSSGTAVAAAALVAAGSVAAATGLTTETATASTRHAHFAATSKQMLGPGPVSGSYRLAGYRILFSDTRNHATQPGTVSIELRYRGRPLTGAQTRLIYRCLDMKMPTHTLTLVPRAAGRYIEQGPRLGMGGRWRITISVLSRQGPTLQLSLTDLIPL